VVLVPLLAAGAATLLSTIPLLAFAAGGLTICALWVPLSNWSVARYGSLLDIGRVQALQPVAWMWPVFDDQPGVNRFVSPQDPARPPGGRVAFVSFPTEVRPYPYEIEVTAAAVGDADVPYRVAVMRDDQSDLRELGTVGVFSAIAKPGDPARARFDVRTPRVEHTRVVVTTGGSPVSVSQVSWQLDHSAPRRNQPVVNKIWVAVVWAIGLLAGSITAGWLERRMRHRSNASERAEPRPLTSRR
jgi:hypothetical protein